MASYGLWCNLLVRPTEGLVTASSCCRPSLLLGLERGQAALQGHIFVINVVGSHDGMVRVATGFYLEVVKSLRSGSAREMVGAMDSRVKSVVCDRTCGNNARALEARKVHTASRLSPIYSDGQVSWEGGKTRRVESLGKLSLLSSRSIYGGGVESRN